MRRCCGVWRALWRALWRKECLHDAVLAIGSCETKGVAVLFLIVAANVCAIISLLRQFYFYHRLVHFPSLTDSEIIILAVA